MLRHSDNVTQFPTRNRAGRVVAQRRTPHHHIAAPRIPIRRNENLVAKYLEVAADAALPPDPVDCLRTTIRRHQQEMEIGASRFALRKVDDALARIASAQTIHEGIYEACLYSLTELEEIEPLPDAMRALIAEYLKALVPELDPDRFEQARATVASLTGSGALQFVDTLVFLRRHLQQACHDLSRLSHVGFTVLPKWAPPSFDRKT